MTLASAFQQRAPLLSLPTVQAARASLATTAARPTTSSSTSTVSSRSLSRHSGAHRPVSTAALRLKLPTIPTVLRPLSRTPFTDDSHCADFSSDATSTFAPVFHQRRNISTGIGNNTNSAAAQESLDVQKPQSPQLPRSSAPIPQRRVVTNAFTPLRTASSMASSSRRYVAGDGHQSQLQQQQQIVGSAPPSLLAAAAAPASTSSSSLPSSYITAVNPSVIASVNTQPQLRLAQITGHFNTPSSQQQQQRRRQSTSTQNSKKMSTQAPHAALLIPGPIEFDDAVLQSMSHYSESHVSQPFVNVFGEVLSMLRKLFITTNPGSQPFVISGSGTLGWDLVAANLAERGDDVLVLHTGYFADSFADCFETYGVKATQLKAPIGDRPQLAEIEKALKEKKYKLITVTHVDTSTGVLSELQALSQLVRRVSPETLLIVDGVCSVGSEEIRFDEWDIDVVLTASQKAIGCPAGLSILMASERAIKTFTSRKTPPSSYFASFKNWLPIMQNYEAKKPSYFATPSPQLIHALHTSLTQILSQPLEARFARHKEVSKKVKAAITELGLKQLAAKPENQANGMTAIYLPDGMTPPQVLPTLLKKGVIFAGGLHKEIATKYVRFGHMGVSVMDPNRPEIDNALKSLKEGLAEVGYEAAK